MTSRSLARFASVVPLVALLSTACDSSSNGPFPHSRLDPLVSITVSAASTTLPVTGTMQYTAVGRNAAGNVMAFTPVWGIVAGGGSISATGLVTAGTVTGSFPNTVNVSAAGVTGTASLTVTAGPLANITVSPNPATPLVLATQAFTAVGRDAFANLVTIIPAWTAVAGGGTINVTSGMFTTGAVTGTFANTIVATSGTVSGMATVTVVSGALASITLTPSPVTLPRLSTQQFVAVGRDASNNVIPFTATWSVVTAASGTISSSGLFTASATAGVYTNTVRVAQGSIAATATVTVTAPGALASIIVSPNPASLNVNGSQLMTAAGFDAVGTSMAIPAGLAWSVVNGGGSINGSTGLFTAGNVAGVFSNTIRATSGLVSGSATATLSAVVAPVIPLGAAAPNGIMAGTAVTCINLGIINADVSISPGNTITGYPPCSITGVQNLANGVALAGQNALTTAFNTAQGLPCPPLNAIVADLGGTTMTPGVYCTASTIGVTGALTLDGLGNPNAEWVFQAGTGLTTAGDVILINGAQAQNVYWVVGTSATLGTASKWQGNILALTSITLVTNATMCGRALARNGAVSLGTGNTITLPGAIPCP